MLDQVIATARLCHGSQIFSWLQAELLILSARSSHSNSQAMPWQPERIMAEANCLWEQRCSYSLPERIIILSARLSHSNSQAMPWQPERINATCQNYPDKAWCSRLPRHSPGGVVSLHTPLVHESRGTHTHFRIIS